jgi:peptidoglycan/xylan/chitin deacetylase (PgdA/CDA1 family)
MCAVRRIACLLVWMFPAVWAQPACDKPVYLTFDTGHMEVAPLVAQVLQRQAVKVTFFVANETTQTGGGSLDAQWLPWWKQRAQEGHAFASHTWDHTYWVADRPGGARVRSGFGAQAGVPRDIDAAAYCADILKPLQHLRSELGVVGLPLYRAPGGKTSPHLLALARRCGFEHVGWSDAGFLGDELPSERYSNAWLLAKALRDVRAGDVLLAHLGIWSRRDPWAPAVLEPLIEGLKQRGFCFATLEQHPRYRAWVAAHSPALGQRLSSVGAVGH